MSVERMVGRLSPWRHGGLMGLEATVGSGLGIGVLVGLWGVWAVVLGLSGPRPHVVPVVCSSPNLTYLTQRVDMKRNESPRAGTLWSAQVAYSEIVMGIGCGFVLWLREWNLPLGSAGAG